MADTSLKRLTSRMRRIEFPIQSELDPDTALDITEVASQTEDPNTTTKDLNSQVEISGIDITPLRDAHRKNASITARDNAVVKLEENVSTNSTAVNVSSLKEIKLLEQPSNQLFGDHKAGVVMSGATELEKAMSEHYKKIYANGESLVELAKGKTPQKFEDVTGSYFQGIAKTGTTEEKQQFWDGARDRYISDIFFLPMFGRGLYHKAIGKGDVENEEGTPFFSKETFFTEEDIEQYEAWEQSRAYRAEKEPAYNEGDSWEASAIAIIADPFASVVKAPFIAGAVSYKILKTTLVANKLEKMFGTSNLLSLVSRSGESLVEFFRADEKMTKLILKETAKSNDPLSSKLHKAAATANIKKIPTSSVILSRSYNSPAAKLAVNAVKTGDVKAQDAVVEAVVKANATKATEELAESQKTLLKMIDAGEAVPLTLLPDNVSSVLSPLTKHGTDVNNALEIANVVGNRIVYDTVTKAQETVTAYHTVRIAPKVEESIQRAVDFGQDGPIFQKVGAINALSVGVHKFTGPARKALLDAVSKNKVAETVIKKGLGKQLKVIYRGLAGREKSSLNKLIYTADNLHGGGEIVEGGMQFGETFVEATPRVLDRFYARQIVMKNTQVMLNDSAVASATKKGWKTFGDGFTAAPMERKHFLSGKESGISRSGKTPTTTTTSGVDKTFDAAKHTDDVKYAFERSIDNASTEDMLSMLKSRKARFEKKAYTGKVKENITAEINELESRLKPLLKEEFEERLVKAQEEGLKVIEDINGNQMGSIGDIPENYKIFEVTHYDDPDAFRYVAVAEEEVEKHFKTMPRQHRLVGNIEDYHHVEYKDKYRVFSLERDGNGVLTKMTPKATSNTWKAAKKFMDKGKLSGEEAAKIAVSKGVPAERITSQDYIAVRASEGVSEFMYSPAFWDDFSKMTDEQMEQVNILFKNNGLSEQELKDLFAVRDRFGYKRQSPLKPRGDSRLPSLTSDGPNILLGQDADAAYMNWVSKYLSEGDYVAQLEKSFVESYGKDFEKITRNVYDRISPIGEHPLSAEASVYQAQIATIAGRRRAPEIAKLDALARSAADKVIRADIPAVSKIMETFDSVVPLPGGLLREASDLTTVMALGSFSAAQLGLQFSAAFVNTVGITAGRAIGNFTARQTTVAAGKAQWDFIEYLATKTPILKQVGGAKKLGKHMRGVYDFVEDSGVAAGIDYDDVGRMLLDSKNLNKWTNLVKKSGATAKHVGATFYREGEGLGQVYSLLVAKRLLEAEGKYKVGSTAFKEAVFERSKTIALNMSKHNASALTQNQMGAVIFKFKDFAMHQGALFDPRGLVGKGKAGLTKGEVAGLYAAWIGAFGVAGLPLSQDMLMAAEMGYGAYTDSPDAAVGKFTRDFMVERGTDLAFQLEKMGLNVKAKTITDYLNGGALKVVNEEIDVATRFTISSFLGDYATNFDEAMLGAVYSKMGKFLGSDIRESHRAFMNMVRDEELSFAAAGKAALPLTNQFSGVASLIKTMNLVRSEDGVLRDKQGRALIVQPNLTQVLLTAIGATPAELVETYNEREILSRQKKAVKEYIWEKSADIAEDYYRSEVSGKNSFDLISNDLKENGYQKLIPILFSQVWGSKTFLDRSLSAEKRQLLETLEFAKYTGNFDSVILKLHGEDK